MPVEIAGEDDMVPPERRGVCKQLGVVERAGLREVAGLLSHNNKSTRYAANLQIPQTPDSVIAPPYPGRRVRQFGSFSTKTDRQHTAR